MKYPTSKIRKSVKRVPDARKKRKRSLRDKRVAAMSGKVGAR